MARASGLAGAMPGAERVVDLEERNWLPRHCRGDTAAFPALLAAYRRPVFGYLVRAGVAESERDDLFQSIFLKIHASAAAYEPGRPLAPWVFTIVVNTVRNHHRGRRRSPMAPSDCGPEDPADPRPGPERSAAARQTLAWLEAAIADLPQAQREVLLLTALAGLPQSEVAEALGLPINTVKTHLRRARLALTRALARRDAPGETDEDL